MCCVMMVAVEEERCIWKVGLKFVGPECAPVKVWVRKFELQEKSVP